MRCCCTSECFAEAHTGSIIGIIYKLISVERLQSCPIIHRYHIAFLLLIQPIIDIPPNDLKVSTARLHPMKIHIENEFAGALPIVGVNYATQ